MAWLNHRARDNAAAGKRVHEPAPDDPALIIITALQVLRLVRAWFDRSSRATAVTASPGAFPQLIRCRYLACSRRCAFQDRARVPGAAPAWRRRKVAPIAGPCW